MYEKRGKLVQSTYINIIKTFLAELNSLNSNMLRPFRTLMS